MGNKFIERKLSTSLRQCQQAKKYLDKERTFQIESSSSSIDGGVGSLPPLSVLKPDVGAPPPVSAWRQPTRPYFFDSKKPLSCPVVISREREHSSTLNYRSTTNAIQLATNKNDVVEAFLLFAQSTNEKLNAQMLTTVCSSLAHLHTKKQLGKQLYDSIFADAESNSEGERWKGLSQEEVHTLVLYHSRRISRYAEKGTSMDYSLSRAVEGSDNSAVGSIVHQIQKCVGTSVSNAPLTALADLLFLDISWSKALEIFQKAKELGGTSVPLPVEMTDRVTALMTCYKTDGIGSRPWELALGMYKRVVDSGYSTTLATHAHALDALWRSGDSFFKKHLSISEKHKEWVWMMVQKVRRNAEDAGLRITGDSGCAYMESLVKVACTAGRWDAVLSVLSRMDLTGNVSRRLLLPTPETLLFAMVACNCARHKSHSEAILKVFEAHYTFGDGHSESLYVYLQSLRHLLSFPGHHIGSIVEKIADSKKKTLSRPCVVACLQLLCSQTVHTKVHKEKLAIRLFEMYDNSVWLQERVPRKVELETVFRCCHLIVLSEKRVSDEGDPNLLSVVRSRIRAVFGCNSEEEQWLNSTEIYVLQHPEDWQHALKIFNRCVGNPKSPAESLPVPLYQAKYSLLHGLLQCCKRLSVTDEDDEAPIFLEEDEQSRQSQEISFVAKLAVDKAHELFPRGDFPHEIVGDFLLLKAAHVSDSSEKKAALAKALQYFSIAPQPSLSQSRIRLFSHISGLTVEHIRDSIIEGHYALRRATLRIPSKSKQPETETKPI